MQSLTFPSFSFYTKLPFVHIYCRSNSTLITFHRKITPTPFSIMAKRHKKSSAQKKAEHDAAVEDIVAHFAQTYISNDRLTALQQLCRDLDVEVGTSINKCKQVIHPMIV